MCCPLCSEKKYLTLRQDKIANLSERWESQFGFSPFPRSSLSGVMNKLGCIECGLVYFSPEIYGDAEFYSKLSKNEWYYESDKWEFDQALEFIKQFRPKSLLEIGCGAGEFLQKAVTGVDFAMGVDINESALELARKKGVTVSSQNIGEIESSFDMIVMFQVLEHIEAPKDLLFDMVAKLNDGGVLILAVPNPDGYLKDMGAMLLDMPPHHCTGWGKSVFEYLSKELKLNMVGYETEPLRYVHYNGFLSTLIQQNVKNSLLRKFHSLVAKLFGPFLFISDKDKILGQSHLVVLQKKQITTCG
jgi:SAM-dependent methyltransferase